jgi:hypothetical protein
MKRRRTLLLSAALVAACAVIDAARADDPVRHELAVVLEPATNRLEVNATITLPETMRAAGTAFTLSEALTVHDSAPPVSVSPGAGDGVGTRYVLDAPAADGVLRLRYGGVIDTGLSDQKEEYTRGFRETAGIVGPEGVYLNDDSAWVPRFSDDMITFSVDVRMPEDWHVISQGNGSSRIEPGRATWDSAGAMEQVYLVGGPLVVATDSAGAVEALVYLHEPDERLSRQYLDATARYIEMYRQLIGPYPYEKFALVENFWETGYGMPSFTLLGPQVIRFPFILHSSYPHEILHNWWGNSVFVDYERGNWCEGLTAYMADHLVQEQRGRGAEYRRNTLQKYRDYVKEGRDFPLADFRSRHSAATEAVGYGKSLMLFHMLRRQVGDDDFRAALARFYRAQRGNRAAFADLQKSFEETTGEDLGPFFEQWVERTGAPSLALREVDAARTDNGWRLTARLDQVQDDAPFMLRVPVMVLTEDGTQPLVVETDARSVDLEAYVDARPLLVSVDPMFDVFRILDPHETPPSIGQIFGEPRILAVMPAASAAEQRHYQILVEAWQSDDHAIDVVLDTDLDEIPADRAAWIFGRDNRLAGLVANDGAVTAGDTIRLAGEGVSFDAHSTVVIARHPANVEKAIGWITADPADAFPGLARKLPHYGKYSYLAFEGSEPTNIVKGQWSPRGSPLIASLTTEPHALPAEPRTALAELPPVFSRATLMEHVAWLADPARDGRGLGSAGIDAAAQYIAERFAAAGLEPGGDDGTWYQRFVVASGPDGTPVEAANVIGVLPGTRPDWTDQSVVLGAHYDHLGNGWPDVHAGDEGVVHPGADDNASGVAVMLELARTIAAEGSGSRNLVVVAFSAEEAGRLGSQHYTEHPRFPLEGVRGMINLDTVGRLGDRPLTVLGAGTCDEWPHIVRGCGFVTGIANKSVPGSAEGSDQASFIDRGIPAVQVFTGAHEDYHRPTDTVEEVDGEGLVKVATFVKEAVTYLREREEPLTVRIAGTTSTPAPPAAGRGRRVLFGTVPDFEFQGEGVRIDSLVTDSPAAAAGLRAGDVIVRIDGEPIDTLRRFSEVLRSLAPGQTVDVTLRRDGSEHTAAVTVRAR